MRRIQSPKIPIGERIRTANTNNKNNNSCNISNTSITSTTVFLVVAHLSLSLLACAQGSALSCSKNSSLVMLHTPTNPSMQPLVLLDVSMLPGAPTKAAVTDINVHPLSSHLVSVTVNRSMLVLIDVVPYSAPSTSKVGSSFVFCNEQTLSLNSIVLDSNLPSLQVRLQYDVYAVYE